MKVMHHLYVYRCKDTGDGKVMLQHLLLADV